MPLYEVSHYPIPSWQHAPLLSLSIFFNLHQLNFDKKLPCKKKIIWEAFKIFNTLHLFRTYFFLDLNLTLLLGTCAYLEQKKQIQLLFFHESCRVLRISKILRARLFPSYTKPAQQLGTEYLRNKPHCTENVLSLVHA